MMADSLATEIASNEIDDLDNDLAEPSWLDLAFG